MVKKRLRATMPIRPVSRLFLCMPLLSQNTAYAKVAFGHNGAAKIAEAPGGRPVGARTARDRTWHDPAGARIAGGVFQELRFDRANPKPAQKRNAAVNRLRNCPRRNNAGRAAEANTAHNMSPHTSTER